jgi:uncharacterized protein (TIGR04255 family)
MDKDEMSVPRGVLYYKACLSYTKYINKIDILMHYDNPPIQEALVSIKLQHLEPFSVDILDSIFLEIKDDFPQKNFAKSMQVNFNKEEGSSVETNDVAGMILKSADGSRAIQIIENAYLFSYVNQYTKWDEFLPEALKYFSIVLEKLNCRIIGTISTRFINNIEVPEDDFSQGNYFTTNITLPEGVAHPEEYFIQYISKNSETTCNVIQTRNSQSNAKDGYVNVILDIDTLLANQIDEEQIKNAGSDAWNTLREAKNKLFDDSLTLKAKGSFDE